MYIKLLYKIYNMTTPYAISRNLGSQTFQGYVNAPINGPLNSSNYPFAMQYHNYGLLVNGGTPPQFYSNQEPVNSNMYVNSRQQYVRATSINNDVKMNENNLGKQSNPIKMVSYSTKRSYPISSHMNYITPIQGSSYTDIKKSIAVGKSSYNVSNSTPIGTKSYDTNYRRAALRRARSGGSTAPKKKGSIYNYSLTQSGINGWGSFPRQNY
jgi:hypothetical protein